MTIQSNRAHALRTFAAIVLYCVCTGGSSAQTVEHWPTADWAAATPESQGMDSGQLADLLAELRDASLPMHSLLVIRNGYLVHETYYYPFTADQQHDVASCTKTVIAMLVGIAIERGKIAGANTKLVDLLPTRDFDRANTQRREVRLEDLLTMRSGLQSFNDGLSMLEMAKSPDWIQFGLRTPATRIPGEKFQYLSTNPHLLSAVLQDATGVSAAQFASRELFAPLGIKKFGWPSDPQGVTLGMGDLRLRPRDMAKLGLLFLTEGRWNGKQIVPAEWIDRSTKPYATTQGRAHYPGYGYFLWIGTDRHAFIGRGGQQIVVIPKAKLIVVTTAAGNGDQQDKIERWIPDRVLAAIRSDAPIPEKAELLKAMASEQQAARAQPLDQAVSEVPDIARELNGARFHFADNLFRAECRLEFQRADKVLLQLTLPGHTHLDPLHLEIVLDNAQRLGPGRYKEPVAVRGRWIDEKTLQLDIDELGNINRFEMQFQFTGDEAQLTLREPTGEMPAIKRMGRREP